MNQQKAISAAKEYAASWDVPWGQVTSAKPLRAWWLLFAASEYAICFENEGGQGVVYVSFSTYRITSFEFFPTNGSFHMVPLWAAYPFYDSVTIGWHMGDGEYYKYSWHDWYRKLSKEAQLKYQQRFPPREDYDDFYAMIADTPGDPDSIGDLIMGRVP